MLGRSFAGLHVGSWCESLKGHSRTLAQARLLVPRPTPILLLPASRPLMTTATQRACPLPRLDRARIFLGRIRAAFRQVRLVRLTEDLCDQAPLVPSPQNSDNDRKENSYHEDDDHNRGGGRNGPPYRHLFNRRNCSSREQARRRDLRGTFPNLPKRQSRYAATASRLLASPGLGLAPPFPVQAPCPQVDRRGHEGSGHGATRGVHVVLDSMCCSKTRPRACERVGEGVVAG